MGILPKTFIARLLNRLPQRQTSPTIKTFAPAEDEPEMTTTPPSGDELEIRGLRFALTYEDAKKDLSNRVVQAYSVFWNTERSIPYLRAHCELRGQVRTFRIDRIETLIEAGTGEVHDTPGEFFEPFLEIAGVSDFKRKHKPRDFSKDAYAMCKPGLHVLVFLAQCDGSFDAVELDVIENFIDWRLAQDALDDAKISRKWLRRVILTMEPDQYDFRSAFDQLLERDTDEATRVLAFAKRLAEADGVLAPEEAEALLELQSYVDETIV